MISLEDRNISNFWSRENLQDSEQDCLGERQPLNVYVQTGEDNRAANDFLAAHRPRGITEVATNPLERENN